MTDEGLLGHAHTEAPLHMEEHAIATVCEAALRAYWRDQLLSWLWACVIWC